jgi:hypothetical protein
MRLYELALVITGNKGFCISVHFDFHPGSLANESLLQSADILNTNNTINPLKPTGNDMYHLFYQAVTLQSVFMGLV